MAGLYVEDLTGDGASLVPILEGKPTSGQPTRAVRPRGRAC